MTEDKENSIKILAERDVKYVELDIDMSDDTSEMLLDYARKNIMNDEKALINWAFIDALQKGLKEMTKNTEEKSTDNVD